MSQSRFSRAFLGISSQPNGNPWWSSGETQVPFHSFTDLSLHTTIKKASPKKGRRLLKPKNLFNYYRLLRNNNKNRLLYIYFFNFFLKAGHRNDPLVFLILNDSLIILISLLILLCFTGFLCPYSVTTSYLFVPLSISKYCK